MERRLKGNTQSEMHFGTASRENAPKQLSMSSAVPMVTCEQPSNQATANRFTGPSKLSTIVPSNEQSIDQMAIPDGMSNMPHWIPETTCEQFQYPADSKSFIEQPSSSSSASASDQPPVSAGRVPSMESASVRKKGRYEAHDRVDRYLLLQVSRHVQTDTIDLLAAYLGISEEQYVDTRTTRTQPTNPRAQAWKVCRDRNVF